MLEVKFGRKDEPSTKFKPSKDMLVVRTRSRRSVRSGPVPAPAAAELNDGRLVMEFPDHGVEVYEVPTGPRARTLDARKEALRASPDVRFAGGVLVDETSGEPVVYTENLFVKFVDRADPEDCRKVLREAGLTIKDEPGYARNAFFAGAPEGTGTKVFDLANQLLKRDDVEFCHPEIVRRRRSRAIYPQQWHLKTTTIAGTQVANSANVEAAHAVTRGEGTTIAVIDDGVDIDHPEFSTPGKVVAPWDATYDTTDPRPKFSRDRHGTACAGVACASGVHGASGVAPAARLMPIRLASELGSMQEADAFRWAADHGADVISCSWGPWDGDWSNPDDPLHQAREPLPASTRLAIDYATTTGRGGKGCVVLFAAGNGRESVDNDGYASYAKVMAVAACNDRGKRSVYSDAGDAVWCAFPSGDQGWPPFNQPDPLTPGIWTTDRRGGDGYNPGQLFAGDAAGHYANDFGGTSSSCPGAAGVAALVLSVNPELRWHEVRDVLKRACDRIDPQGGAYDANGHSAFYGHGRLNAEKAVQEARPAEKSAVTVVRDFYYHLPDLQAVSAELHVTETQPIESVAVQVDLRHTYISDLVVTLIPPAATGGKVVLHDRAGGSRDDLRRTYDAVSAPRLATLRGKSPAGKWTLRVEDKEQRDTGTLVRFGVTLTFPPATRTTAALATNGAGARRSKARRGARRGPPAGA